MWENVTYRRVHSSEASTRKSSSPGEILVDEYGRHWVPNGAGGFVLSSPAGGQTARRKLATKLRNLTHRRFWVNGGYELMRLPQTWAAGAIVAGESRLSTDGKTIWIASKDGNTTAEPVRDPIYPEADILDAGGVVIWSPFDASRFPLTKKDTLRNAAGDIAIPTVRTLINGTGAVTDALGNTLTERYNRRNAISSLAPTTYLAYQAANNPKVDSPASWVVGPSAEGGYVSNAHCVEGVVQPVAPDTAGYYRFFTKAKGVAITLQYRTGNVVGETTIAAGNIVVDGAALDFANARAATVTNTSYQHQYIFTFADEVEREFVVWGGAYPQSIYTSASQDIYAQPSETVRALFASDSTGAGAAPGPHGAISARWGQVAAMNMGALGMSSIATGGIGYLSRPISPKWRNGTWKALNIEDKIRLNQPYWDRRAGAPKMDYVIFDQVGWDVDSTGTYISENAAYTYFDNGGDESWVINKESRRAGFRRILKMLLAYQPEVIVVSVTARTELSIPHPSLKFTSRGYWNFDPARSRDSRINMDAMSTDWLEILEEVVPAGQLCLISLADFDKNLSLSTGNNWMSRPQGDSVHPTTQYHIEKGLYVAKKFLAWLSAA